MGVEQILEHLATTAPWSRLRPAEREIVSAVLHEVRFAPHSLVQPAGEVLSRLLWRIEGDWSMGGQCQPAMLGVAALLEGMAFDSDLVAGPEGVTCLTLNPGHFFTINSECPALLLGWMTLADAPPAERTFR